MTAKRATISFSERDLHKLEELRKALDLATTNQAISAAIKIADEIRERKLEGEIIFRNKNNEERYLVIPGLEARNHVV